MEGQEKKYRLSEETITTEEGVVLHRIIALKRFKCGEYYIGQGQKGGFIENEKNLEHEGNCWVRDDAMVYGHAQVLRDAVVCQNAQVYDFATVSDNAWIYGHAKVYNYAQVYNNVSISGQTLICDDCQVYGYTNIDGKSVVCNDAMVSQCSILHSAVVRDGARVKDAHIINSIIENQAQVSGKCVIKDSIISDMVAINDYATIEGCKIKNYTVVNGKTVLKQAEITNSNDFITIRNSWSSGRWFTYIRPTKQWIVGCFIGTGEELIKKAYIDSDIKGKCYELSVKYVEGLYNTLESYQRV